MNAKDKMSLLLSTGPLLSHNVGDEEENTKDAIVDEILIKKGISFFHKNFFSMFVCMLIGLLSLMYIESIAAVLYLTKKSGSPALAFKRYLATLKHTLNWYKGPTSLEESLKTVRAKHKNAANLASGTDHSMTQYDMVLTQWAFIGPALLFPSKLGILKSSERDFDGLVYIMYWVGKHLGIKEDLNLFTDGLEPAIEYSELILKEVIKRQFGSDQSSETCKDMAKHLLDGVNILNPFIDQIAFHHYSNLILNDQELNEKTAMHPFSQFMYKSQILVLGSLIHIPVLGWIIRFLANNLMKLNIYLATDWCDYIVDNLNSSKADTGLGQLQAFLAIPVFTVISGSTVAYQEARKNKILPIFIVILLILKITVS